MDFILVGPGRAGLALSIRLNESGHRPVGVLARDPAAARQAAHRFEVEVLGWGKELPPADLLVLAVRDDAISEVASLLAPHVGVVESVVHLSGLTPVAALESFSGQMIGSFHPLQTLPTPEVGAARLVGSWVAITTREDYLADRLFEMATSAGMHGFELDDDAKAVYHAAAAAAANFPLAALAMSKRLFDSANVPFEAAAPLVQAVVENAFAMGPVQALTGPIARGDVGTVRAQLAAVRDAAPDLVDDFVAYVRATARVAGTGEEMEAAFA
jgi:predicted short-subunit dehydrogenase-like oxidoreductase (DUF2520 family)